LATAGIGAVPVGFGAQSLVKERRRIKIRFDEKGIQIPFPPPVLIWEDRKQRNEEGRVMNVEFHF
jgi:small-conductance mechanosensitive channel